MSRIKKITVRDLIEELEQFDPDSQILRYRFETKQTKSTHSQMYDHRWPTSPDGRLRVRWGSK
jgi:hypothetical protein